MPDIDDRPRIHDAASLAVDSSGTCQGYAVDSRLEFQCLRAGHGIPLDVMQGVVASPSDGSRLIDRSPKKDYPHRVRLTEAAGVYHLEIDRLVTFAVRPAAPSVLMSEPLSIRCEAALWGIPSALCALSRGDRAIHAAAVEVEGAAILLAAPGHFGKTTLASAFTRAGYRLLAEDFTACQVLPVPAVLPGPALIRLREDVAAQVSPPGWHEVLRTMGRSFLLADLSERGNSRPVRLKAMVFLRRAAAAITLERVAAAHALRDLWSLAFWLPRDEDRVRCFDALASLARTVPAWNLYRPLEFGMLDRTVEMVVSMLATHRSIESEAPASV